MGFITVVVCLLVVSQATIYDKYYNEAYKVTQAMQLDHKIGQTIQADFAMLTTKTGTDQSLALKYSLGSVLAAGDGVPDASGNMVQLPPQDQKIKQAYLNGTLQSWQTLANKFNGIGPQITTAEGKTFRVKLLLGTDAVHNNQHVVGTILFPHNSGLACSHNSANFFNAGYWTGYNVKKSGFNYAFAPTVAVSHNPQWGRFYETMGQEDAYIGEYAKQYVKGLQNIDGNGSWGGVVGSVKHFFGDGATLFGADEGNARVHNFKSFLNHNIQGYKGAISSEVGTVMCSYSAINGVPMAINGWIGPILRNKLNFDGFVISDYDEMNRIVTQKLPTSFINMSDYEATSTMMNSGVDMFMLPGYLGQKGIIQYIDNIKISLKNNTLSLRRLDDAVTRILSVKMAMGLLQPINKTTGKPLAITPTPEVDSHLLHPTSSGSEYQDALQAVHESLVLLKNDNKLLPIRGLKTGAIQYVVLVGERVINVNHLSKNFLFRSFDNIGMQCGGWTLRWQGFEGNELWRNTTEAKQANASTILTALEGIAGAKTKLVYPSSTTFEEKTRVDIEREQYITELKTLRKNMTANNTIIIGVVGESPFAEFVGDVNIPYCKGGPLAGDGCLYNNVESPYLPENQRTTLEVDYEKFDKNVITTVREADKNIPVFSILLAGRPMLIKNVTDQSTAVMAAWLPGTAGGQGIVDAITGDYLLRSVNKTNTLAFDWPSTMGSLYDFPVYPASGDIPVVSNATYTVGYGLATS